MDTKNAQLNLFPRKINEQGYRPALTIIFFAHMNVKFREFFLLLHIARPSKLNIIKHFFHCLLTVSRHLLTMINSREVSFFFVNAWRRWTLIELRMCSHYLPWNWDLPKTTIDDDFFLCGRKIWHRIDHNGSIKSYLKKHYQPALSLSLAPMFCAARVFLFMIINAFKPLRAAQFVSHRSIFNIMQSSLFYWLSFFISQSDIA